MSTSETTGHADVLAGLPLLRPLNDDVRALVEGSFAAEEHGFGSVIVREGEQADAYYVVASGRVRILQQGEEGGEVPLGTLGPGEGFGEAAFLDGGRRTATIRAATRTTVLRLDRSIFQALLRQEPSLRTAMERRRRADQVSNALKRSALFRDLPEDVHEDLLDALEEVEVSDGETIVREGEVGGPMYFVLDGKLRAVRGTSDLAYLRVGDVFGEASLLRHDPRAASVEALTDARLLRLPFDAFERLLERHAEFRRRVEERAAQYEYRAAANVPLDFAEELLPAAAAPPEHVPSADVEPGEDALASAAGTWDPRFRKPDQPIRSMPFVYQIDEMDCGAACLAMVTRHFGRKVSLARIREVVATGIDGTSLLGITRGAEAIGLLSTSVKVSKSRVDAMPLPAIVHWEENHWIVVYDVRRDHVRVADPAKGLRKIKREEFLEKWSGYTALLAPTPALHEMPESRAGLGWALRFLRPHRGALVRAVILSIVAAALGMFIPVLGQQIFDRAVGPRDLDLVNVLALAMIGVLVLMVAASALQRYVLGRRAFQIDIAALDQISGRLLSLPLRYFQLRREADIARRLMGMRMAREVFIQQGVTALTAAMQVLVAVALMFVYSWQLALVFLTVLPVYAVLVRLSIRRLRPIYEGLDEAFGKHHAHQLDAVKGIETVKAMGAEAEWRRELRTEFEGLARKVFHADLAVMLYEVGIQLVTFLSLALFLWFGARQAIAGEISLGELVSFNALVLLANAPIMLVLSVLDNLQYAGVLLNRLNDVWEQEPEQPDADALREVPSLEGRVSLRRVSFAYPGIDPVPVIEDVSLEVEPGTNVAIVGRSGSGKTTLARLLAGLITPTEGSVLYDGVDLRELDLRSLRRHVGVVLQESYLFDTSIARNIAFGEEHPDLERVRWAARLANADGFVERLPLGYHTRVGETGILLSGGQKQRIAIARAVYRRPPVLVFDEATSSLDSESERAVQDNLDRLLEGRTSFVIAHRLSTIRNADTIVVLEAGRIAERGSHDELLQRRGLYFYLVSQQLDLE